MKHLRLFSLLSFFILVCSTIQGQKSSSAQLQVPAIDSSELNTYLIEREIPGAGNLTKKDLKDLSIKSCNVLKLMGPDIQWIESYITENKIYCIYRAKNEDQIREHAQKGGFPVDVITQLKATIGPSTAD